MGTVIKNFLVGVYKTPSSICSHIVRLSYTPPLKSNGVPLTKWNMMYDPITYVMFVKVHDHSLVTPGSKLKNSRNNPMMTMWMIHAPRWLTQVAFMFVIICWSFSSSNDSGSTYDIILEERLLLWSLTGSMPEALLTLSCPYDGNGFNCDISGTNQAAKRDKKVEGN